MTIYSLKKYRRTFLSLAVPAVSLLALLALSSCASLRKADIEVPKDIQSKTTVSEIPQNKQKEDKEITVTQHLTKIKTAKPAEAAKTVVTTIKNPFKVGEKISLDLYYIGIRAATLLIEVMPPVTVNGKKAFHFKGIAETTSLMKYIYRVYDVIDTYVDYQHFVPVRMTLTMDESKQNVSMVLAYDHQKGRSTFWKKRIDPKGIATETRREDDMTPYAQDIFSSLYFIRTHDIKIGDELKFVIHDNGKNWNMTIDVVKKENIWTRLGSVDTFLLVPTVERDGEKFTKGKLSLWITADEKKVPVKFEAEVRIGTMKGMIKDYVVPKN
jgi:hypothetical protein